MLKKTTLGLASVALLLSGCMGPKEEYTKGISLYEKGDYESLVKAKSFFNNYTEKHPDDGGVDKWVSKIDSALVQKAKNLAIEAYAKKDTKNALKYIEVAKSGAPNDKEILKAYSLAKKAYSEQVKYDKFSSYLEDVYIEAKDISGQWDSAVKLTETGKAQPLYLLDTAKNLYPKAITLREKVNAESFEINGAKDTTFGAANSALFTYIVDIEKELSRIMLIGKTNDVSQYTTEVESLTPESLNAAFLDIQDKMQNYVNEKDNEGNEKRNIKNTLQFTKAYQERKAEEKKAAEEALQKAQPATAQPTTPSQKVVAPTSPTTANTTATQIQTKTQ
ncbi:hypothetical protein [Priestia aryabhattai]